MRRGDYTIILARCGQGPARKYRISRRFALGLSLGCLALVTAFILSTLHYFYMWSRTTDYDHLEAKSETLVKENESFRIAAKQLTDRLSSLEVTSKKLQLLSGLDPDGMGGVGGPPASAPVLRLDSRHLLKHFRSLDRKTISLQTELSRLYDYYVDRSLLLAATPSIMPVNGYPSGRYGYRKDPFTGQREFHPGIDISAPRGNKVVATADGTVEFAGRKLGYGKLVVLEHRFGITTRYGHMARIVVKRGQKITKGDIVGYVGSTGRSTGPHVHYEVRLNNRPLDPLRFFHGSS